MLILGDFNRLKVARTVDFGVYLESEDGDVLMPAKYVPEGTKPGDEIDAFVYRDSEDRIIATTLQPKGRVNQFAVLKVVDENNHGSFMDLGLEKDLFVPYSNQKDRMVPGQMHPVYIYTDEITDRLIGTAKIGKYIENEDIRLREGDKADLLVIGRTELGYKVIIDQKYLGIVYNNEVFKPLEIGDITIGYIKKIRPDNKIDVSLQKAGYEEVIDASDIILSALEKNNAILPLSDSSTPEEIKEYLGMSKKTFKKAIGGLYKKGLIEILESSIKLK